jgi:putative ABC transport system permease protein
MSVPRRSPSTLVVWLLRRFASRADAEALVGDAEEALQARVASGTVGRWPRLWLNGRLTADLAAAVWTLTGRLVIGERHVLRDAWRSLRWTPGTSLFALAILAVGMTGAIVTFSVVDAVIFRPFPFGSTQDLVAVSGNTPTPIVSALEFDAWRRGAPAFDGLAAYRGSAEVLPTASSAILIPSVRTTASLFAVLHVQPVLGHVFSPDDEQLGRERVIVISYELWQRLFGGDVEIIGRRVPFRAGPATVIGVMPPGFTFPVVSTDESVEAWTPYIVPATERPGAAHGISRSLSVIGRLRHGATRDQASSQMVASVSDVRHAFPFGYDKEWRPVVVPLDEAWFGPVRDWMLLVLWAVVVVMTIACANVANLLLIRSTARVRELGVRAALGASRRHLVAAVLTESLLLSGAAAAIGLAASVAGVRMARAALPAGILRSSTIAIDLRVLLVVAAAAVLTGIGFGMVPAWQASRTDAAILLKDAAPAVTAGRGRWRTFFLVSEVAFVGILLVATTLFVSSFVRVVRADLGFGRQNLVAVRPDSSLRGSVSDVVRGLRQTPGIQSAAAFSGASAPLIGAAFGGGTASSRVSRPDRPDIPALNVEFLRVSREYFGTAAIPIVRGRPFDDVSAAETEIMLDETAARTLFPDREAVGAIVTVASKPRTVAGIAASVRLGGPGTAPKPQLYLPFIPRGGEPQFLVRTSIPAPRVVSALTTTVAQFLPPGTHVDVVLVDDAFRRLTADRRFNAGVLGIFGLVAVFIGAAGIYSVMASVVAQRQREFAVRMALGATATRLRRALLIQTGRQIAAGLAIGLPVAWWISRMFAALLFEVKPTDWSPYLIVTALVTAVSLAAALAPARRAGRVDLIATLKA